MSDTQGEGMIQTRSDLAEALRRLCRDGFFVDPDPGDEDALVQVERVAERAGLRVERFVVHGDPDGEHHGIRRVQS